MFSSIGLDIKAACEESTKYRPKNICSSTASWSKSNLAQNKSENVQITYLNIAGQRWNHNAQNQDRYRRDWTHLPGSPVILLWITYILRAKLAQWMSGRIKNKPNPGNNKINCSGERHESCSACFVTRARQKMLRGDWTSVSSGNVGCVSVARLLCLCRLLPPPTHPSHKQSALRHQATSSRNSSMDTGLANDNDICLTRRGGGREHITTSIATFWHSITKAVINRYFTC